MSKMVKTIQKNINRYRQNGYFRAKFQFTNYYEKLSIIDNLVLIQSYDGSSISGNPYYLLKELCENPNYHTLRKVIVVRKKSVNIIKENIKRNRWKNIDYVIIHSKKYCKVLASAKYLINNSTFPVYFIKKEGQVYLNTWHGTPLKTLGKMIEAAPNEIGNTQRNFLMSDYLLYPNKFTFDRMRNDYMLNNYFKGKYVLAGYPRNEAFFDESKKEKIKQKYNLKDKKIAVYMPTWKGTLETKNVGEQMIYMQHAIYEMEEKLDDDIIVYVKLHNYVKKTLDLEHFEKIREMPSEYETYEFLNIADCLITDYSSVLFDYMNTNKKIILYAYDLKEYVKERGMYLDFKSLPFSLTYNTEDLVNEINNINQYKDYSKEMHEYIEYDGPDSSKNICELLFKNKVNKKIEIIDGTQFSNKKKNILMFPGALFKNGITTAFRGLMEETSKHDDKNYTIVFYKSVVKGNLSYVHEFIKNNYDYMVLQGQRNMTIMEAICQFLYFKCNLNTKFINKKIKELYNREVKRLFPNMHFDYAIHFSGYESKDMHMISAMENTKKIIWAHNNIYKEIETKGNIHKNSLKFAYNTFDKIVVVRESMKEELMHYVKDEQKGKIAVVHNINDIEGIKSKAQQDIKFEENTQCNVSMEQLKNILENEKITKFINIARFSKEKGLDRLIDAFTTYNKVYDNEAYLILIGGYGKEYKNIMFKVKNEKINNVIIIKSIVNPYPILNKCDVFVLSSIYEGLPMTLMEALILDKSIISTDITGPREFLKQGYGYLVENSTEGILQGLIDFKQGKKMSLKKFDAEKFNEMAEKEYYKIIE